MASTESKKYITGLMNFGVIVLSIVLIVWISIDTFELLLSAKP